MNNCSQGVDCYILHDAAVYIWHMHLELFVVDDVVVGVGGCGGGIGDGDVFAVSSLQTSFARPSPSLAPWLQLYY